MIEVGVRQQDRVELSRVIGERDAVANRLVGAALEHAAVDEHLGLAGREQELRAGDRGGRAQELKLHQRGWSHVPREAAGPIGFGPSRWNAGATGGQPRPHQAVSHSSWLVYPWPRRS